MDDVQVGLVLRALRRRLGWRQADVARRAGISQQSVSRVERGMLEHLELGTTRRVATTLGATLAFQPRWRGADLAGLLDADHAAVVEAMAALLARRGWVGVAEFSFNRQGERGSVDLLGWHAADRALLIVEVKSRLVDVQDTLRGLDRKCRIVPAELRRQRGLAARMVGCLLVLPATSASRAAVARHRATFAADLPGDARDARRWLRQPVGTLRAVWFMSSTPSRSGKRTSRSRVRSAAQDPHTSSGPRAPRQVADPALHSITE